MRTSKCRFYTRKTRIRFKILRTSKGRLRLSVFRSCKHLYAQIIDDFNSKTLVSASTLDSSIRKIKKSNSNIDSAIKVGSVLAKRALLKGIKKVVFDKGGYKYHGVIKAIAEEARKDLEF